MPYEIMPSSEKMKEQAEKKRIGEEKYPWKELQIGQSFAVPVANLKFNSLRSQASIVGKRLKRRFRVIEHSDGKVYEVALISIDGEFSAEGNK